MAGNEDSLATFGMTSPLTLELNKKRVYPSRPKIY